MKKEEVEKISKLSRIELTQEEIERLRGEFSDILEHIKKIDELDLKDTSPVSHPFDITNVFRKDEIVPGLRPEAFLKNSPSNSRGMIRVPKVIEK